MALTGAGGVPRSGVPGKYVRTSRAATWGVIGGYFALYAAVGALYPYLPVYYESLGLGLDAIGLLAAVFAAAGMIGAPLWGATADRLGAAYPILMIAAACAAVAAFALAIANGTLMIAVTAACLSLTMAGIAPILDARAVEVVGTGHARYARLRVWGSATFIVAVVVTGWLVQEVGVGAMFAVLVPTLAATALTGLAIRSRPLSAPLTRLTALTSVVRAPTLMWFLGAALLAWSSAAAVNAFFSIHLIDIGAPESLVGSSWAIGAAVEVPIMIAFPLLERRLGLDRLLLLGAAFFAARTVAVLVSDDPLLVALSMLIHGAAFALLLVGGVMYVSKHSPTGAAATAQGMLAATVFGMAQVIGPGLGGVLGRAFGLTPMFALAGLGSAIAFAALTVMLRARSTGAPAPT